MSLICPKCGTRLKALSVRNRFACPACGATLEGHVAVPLIIGICLWSIIELIIKQAIDPAFGYLASLLGIGIGACIGLPLMFWLMNTIGTVDASDGTSPPTGL